ncbi:siroheme decarboxylase subunit beta [Ovoidimarina sediminis]|uniref:siroheme decarboxylase subunit beta n=1 Tax=Ovoidimarina sediminis TaxID=3079856 RepID=UPI00290A4DC8|nr:Lrp/AsnC family transcriptional regulator [Rhodophyticola sp. MJ-SS7]MDU8941843.1 Lrp/AsnC family transcriptional regulator [Rhodophyticola sp. MJ-SS7]
MDLDNLDWRMMNAWQRGLPLEPCPFRDIAGAMKIPEEEVLTRLRALQAGGAISRVGGTCRPNTLAASTLAAVAAPAGSVEEVAAIINSVEGVNHSYERENPWNIWFVATGPTRAFVDAALERIGALTGLQVLDLRLVRPFNVDLGFALDGTGRMPPPRAIDETVPLEEGDRALMQALSEGLDLVDRPFAALGARLGRSEEDVLSRVRALKRSGVLSRIGLIVRHRALGWRSNAMCVFEVPPEEIEEKGRALTEVQGVTLCYERRPVPGIWPYTLYCMIHGRSRAEALDVLSLARVRAKLTEYDYRVLFSTRCFKQTGALIDVKEKT